MFIDYVTLLLINMAAGLFILAVFVFSGMEPGDRTKWAPGFAVAGLVAFVGGLYMTLTWPLPGSFNMAFGELSVLFGAVFLGAALAAARGWCMCAVTWYAFFAGAAAVLIGVRIIDLSMTMKPLLSGAGFMLTGVGGMCSYAALKLRRFKTVRIIGGIVILAAVAIWAVTGYTAYWGHMASFKNYIPPTVEMVK